MVIWIILFLTDWSLLTLFATILNERGADDENIAGNLYRAAKPSQP
jgi:hypothetical protein